MFEDEFLEMMIDTVTLERRTGVDADGVVTYGPPSVLKCRISPKPKQILTMTGREVVSTATIHLVGAPEVSPEDRVTMPDGDQPPILRVARPPDRDGPHHTEIFV
jgi:hypothetical protein